MNKKNSEICVIIAANLNYTPFYYRYEKIFLDQGIDFDLILWNRSGTTTDAKANNIYEYNLRDEANNGNWKKIWKFISFSHFVKEIIRKNKYRYLMFLGTNSGNGVFLADYLKKNYNERYLVDVRDYTYEWFKPFYWLENILIRAAESVVISSEGFRSFLPEERDYIMAHNIDWDSINEMKDNNHTFNQNPIRISFIGNMRYYPENYKFIDLMGNDKRFVLQYFGTGCEKIQDYCIENNITNVKFKGKFDRHETASLYSETDIINNLYGNNKTFLKLALSNKLYYSLFIGRPILVCKDTYMEVVSHEGGIGFSIDYSDPLIKEKLIKFYMDYNPVTEKSEALKNRILREDSEFVSMIIRRIHSI